MEFIHVENDLHFIANALFRAWIDTGNEDILAGHKVQEGLIPHQFGHIHFGGNLFAVNVRRGEIGIMDVLRADSEGDLLAVEVLLGRCEGIGDMTFERSLIH